MNPLISICTKLEFRLQGMYILHKYLHTEHAYLNILGVKKMHYIANLQASINNLSHLIWLIHEKAVGEVIFSLARASTMSLWCTSMVINASSVFLQSEVNDKSGLTAIQLLKQTNWRTVKVICRVHFMFETYVSDAVKALRSG